MHGAVGGYQYPREIVLLNESPKTASGEFLRRRLKEAWKQQVRNRS